MERDERTEEIIGIFYKVYNSLGYGFLEKIYERAMAIEFRKAGIKFENQVPVKVFYPPIRDDSGEFDGEVVGNYVADFIVEGRVIVEVKAARDFCESDGAQLLNYLRATGINVGLLLNFGKKADIKRRVYEKGWVENN